MGIVRGGPQVPSTETGEPSNLGKAAAKAVSDFDLLEDDPASEEHGYWTRLFNDYQKQLCEVDSSLRNVHTTPSDKRRELELFSAKLKDQIRFTQSKADRERAAKAEAETRAHDLRLRELELESERLKANAQIKVAEILRETQSAVAENEKKRQASISSTFEKTQSLVELLVKMKNDSSK